ncbi:MAG TPA: class II aldolase/adducin family protein [Dehalococcoidia bacterium]|nr:class II aldolase/adducin family protein [Dehalococcoidia bacterium]
MVVPEGALRQLQEVGRMLWEAGLVSSHGGNLSLRLTDGAVVITSHGSMLGRLDTGSLVVLGREGGRQPSSDTDIHLAVYEATPAGAVVHAHPRHAIALSLSDQGDLEPPDLEGRHYLGKRVPVVGGREHVAEALCDFPIVVVRGHGSYARGRDLWEALLYTSVLEESAQVLWLLRSLR